MHMYINMYLIIYVCIYIYICDKRKYKQNAEVSSCRNHAVVLQKKTSIPAPPKARYGSKQTGSWVLQNQRLTTVKEKVRASPET